MGRAPCCDKANVKKGPWSPEEDAMLKDFIAKFGTAGNWISLPQKAGLKRCGKSCRLRWLNYLRPDIKHGEFSQEEDRIIYTLYATIGSKWSIIASQLPGRTDNDIKNYWNTKLKKKLIMGINYPLHNSLQQPTMMMPTHTPLSLSQNFHFNNNVNTTTFNEYYAFEMQDGLITNRGRFNNTFVGGGGGGGNNNEDVSCSSSSEGGCSKMRFGDISEKIKKESMSSYDYHQGYLSNGYEDEQRLILDYGATNYGDVLSIGNIVNPNHELL